MPCLRKSRNNWLTLVSKKECGAFPPTDFGISSKGKCISFLGSQSWTNSTKLHSFSSPIFIYHFLKLIAPKHMMQLLLQTQTQTQTHLLPKAFLVTPIHQPLSLSLSVHMVTLNMMLLLLRLSFQIFEANIDEVFYPSSNPQNFSNQVLNLQRNRAKFEK